MTCACCARLSGSRGMSASKARWTLTGWTRSPATARVGTDAEIDAFIRRTALTAHHPAGTCRIGSDGAAVVDPALRVRGVDGLRVIDASVMPDLVSAHINACVIMIGEKGADLVRGVAVPSGTAAAA